MCLKIALQLWVTLNFYSANKAKYRNKFYVEADCYKETLLNNPRAYLSRVHFNYGHYIATSRPGRKSGEEGGAGSRTGKCGNRGLENYSSVMWNPMRKREESLQRHRLNPVAPPNGQFLPSTHCQLYFLYSFHSNLRFFSYSHFYFSAFTALSLHDFKKTRLTAETSHKALGEQ